MFFITNLKSSAKINLLVFHRFSIYTFKNSFEISVKVIEKFKNDVSKCQFVNNCAKLLKVFGKTKIFLKYFETNQQQRENFDWI